MTNKREPIEEAPLLVDVDREAGRDGQTGATPDELDQRLLARLKASAEKRGFTPDALLLAGESAAEFQRLALVPILGPFPSAIDEVTVGEKALANWPAWVAELVPSGSKFERLHWPDGTITIRLVNHHSLVLAANFLPA